MDYILGRVVFWLGALMKNKITSPLNPCPAQGSQTNPGSDYLTGPCSLRREPD